MMMRIMIMIMMIMVEYRRRLVRTDGNVSFTYSLTADLYSFGPLEMNEGSAQNATGVP